MVKSVLNIEIKALPAEEGDNSITFEGYLVTWDLDKAGDIFTRGAFKDDVGKSFAVFWDHGWLKGKPPIGSLIVLAEDEIGVKVLGTLPLEDEFVEGRIAPHLRSGTIKEMSAGFTALKSDTKTEGGIRTISKATMMEGSLVNFACNTQATVTSVKYVTKWDDLPKKLADRAYMWDSSAADKRIREKTGATEEPSAEYANMHLWHDADKADNFTAYKLLIADVINGEIAAVPRAIFAVRGVLAGARGGVDIPEDEIPAIKDIVNRYYDIMDLEQPFVAGKSMPFTLTELKALPKSLLQDVLKECEICNSAVKFLVSVISAQEVPMLSVKDDNKELTAVDLALKNALNQLEKTNDRNSNT